MAREGSESPKRLESDLRNQTEWEEGIYFGDRADQYLVIEKGADGKKTKRVFNVPEYTLDYLKRAYRGRLEFKPRPDGQK